MQYKKMKANGGEHSQVLT